MSFQAPLVGQERAVQFLRSAIANDKVGHAYLFSGPVGIGKLALAINFSRWLNCQYEVAADACGCESCRKITSGVHSDIKLIGEDRSVRSIKKADVMELRSWLILRPLEAKKKVAIVDVAERFTEEAANAFLKSLEEPPANVVLILLVHDTGRMLGTILSRTIEVVLRPVSSETIVAKLGPDKGPDEVLYVARRARGSVGAAQELLRVGAFEEKNAIISKAMMSGWACVFTPGAKKDVYKDVLDVAQGFFRDCILVMAGDTSLCYNQDRVCDIRHVVDWVPRSDLYKMIEVIDEALCGIEKNYNQRLSATRVAMIAEKIDARLMSVEQER